jgi:septal ring-binding cell division protein DamX
MEYSPTQAQRDGLLQQALHLIHYGRTILVIGGESCEIKSAWLNELEYRCTEDDLYLCSMELTGPTGDLQMLSMIALGLGIDYQRSGIDSLYELLNDFLLNQPYSERPVVLIRNAQLLDSTTLVHIQLLSEAEEGIDSFQFVLVYSEDEAVIAPSWSSLQNLYEIQIEPELLPVGELAREPELDLYTAQDGGQVSAKQSPAFKVYLDEATKLARPKKLKLSQYVAFFIEAMKQKTVFGFPRIHLMVLSIVAVGIIFALLLAQQETKQTIAPPVLIALEVPKLKRILDGQSKNNTEVSGSIRSDAKQNKELDPQIESLQSSAVAAAEAPAIAKVPDAKSEILQKRKAATEFGVSPAIAKKVAPTSRPVDSVANTKKPLTEREKYEKQLLALNPKLYTLQLFGSHDQGKALAFIGKYPNLPELRYYRGQHSGKPWYMVVSGLYVDQTSAAEGVKRLPSALRRQKPWARMVLDIQSSILKYSAAP